MKNLKDTIYFIFPPFETRRVSNKHKNTNIPTYPDEENNSSYIVLATAPSFNNITTSWSVRAKTCQAVILLKTSINHSRQEILSRPLCPGDHIVVLQTNEKEEKSSQYIETHQANTYGTPDK